MIAKHLPPTYSPKFLNCPEVLRINHSEQLLYSHIWDIAKPKLSPLLHTHKLWWPSPHLGQGRLANSLHSFPNSSLRASGCFLCVFFSNLPWSWLQTLLSVVLQTLRPNPHWRSLVPRLGNQRQILSTCPSQPPSPATDHLSHQLTKTFPITYVPKISQF